MADAGKILIVPKGDYSANASYEVLDLVKHNQCLWLAKKDVTGVEPSDVNTEYWFKLVDESGFATTADLANFDADTVDGKHAEDFQTAPINVGFPSGSNIEISFDRDTIALISTIGWNGNFYSSYLYHGYSAGSTRQKVVNLTTSGSFPYELSETEQKLIIHNGTTASGACSIEILHGNPCTTKIVENPTTYPTTTPLPETYVTAKGNLPLSGGTLNNSASTILTVKSDSGNNCYIKYTGPSSNLGAFGFKGVDQPVMLNGAGNTLTDILHTGNKPSGSYTGNGSATERNISIGGIGGIVYLYNRGTGEGALAYGNGILVFRGSEVTHLTSSTGYFWEGTLKIKSSNGTINGSGNTIDYWLL